MILDEAVIQVVENNEGIPNKDINHKLTVVRLYNYFDAHKLQHLLLQQLLLLKVGKWRESLQEVLLKLICDLICKSPTLIFREIPILNIQTTVAS